MLILADKLHKTILKDRRELLGGELAGVSKDELVHLTGVIGPDACWNFPFHFSSLEAMTLSYMHLSLYGWVGIHLGMIKNCLR